MRAGRDAGGMGGERDVVAGDTGAGGPTTAAALRVRGIANSREVAWSAERLIRGAAPQDLAGGGGAVDEPGALYERCAAPACADALRGGVGRRHGANRSRSGR